MQCACTNNAAAAALTDAPVKREEEFRIAYMRKQIFTL